MPPSLCLRGSSRGRGRTRPPCAERRRPSGAALSDRRRDSPSMSGARGGANGRYIPVAIRPRTAWAAPARARCSAPRRRPPPRRLCCSSRSSCAHHAAGPAPNKWVVIDDHEPTARQRSSGSAERGLAIAISHQPGLQQSAGWPSAGYTTRSVETRSVDPIAAAATTTYQSACTMVRREEAQQELVVECQYAADGPSLFVSLLCRFDPIRLP